MIELFRVTQAAEHCFRHAVVDVRFQGTLFVFGQRAAVGRRGVIGNAALQALHGLQPAVAGDVRRTRRPRRNRAGTRNYQEQLARRRLFRHLGAVGQDFLQGLLLRGRQLALAPGEVPEFGIKM